MGMFEFIWTLITLPFRLVFGVLGGVFGLVFGLGFGLLGGLFALALPILAIWFIVRLVRR